jgi:hypothetical protein
MTSVAKSVDLIIASNPWSAYPMIYLDQTLSDQSKHGYMRILYTHAYALACPKIATLQVARPT